MSNNDNNKNYLLINFIQLLFPLNENDLNKKNYLEIIINNQQNIKSNSFTFKSLSENKKILNIKINLTQYLEKLEINYYCDNLSIYSGEINLTKHESSLIGLKEYSFYLESKKESNLLINFSYYNNLLTLPVKDENSNSMSLYDEYLKQFMKESEEKNSGLKKIIPVNGKVSVSILDLAAGKNAEDFNKFLKNMDYLKGILSEITDIIYWKDPYKTISLLSIISLNILYTNFFLLFLIPLYIIFFHLDNRQELIKKYSYINNDTNKIANLQLIIWIIQLTNEIFSYYETFLEALQYTNKELVKEIYFNIIKLVIFNIPIYYIIKHSFLSNIDIRFGLVLIIWIIVLLQYPPFHAFVYVLFKIINKMFFNLDSPIQMFNLYLNNNIKNILLEIIPFLNIIIKIIQKDVSIKDLNTPKIVKMNNNQLNEMLKYEIYEKERWWVGLRWIKTLLKSDGEKWVKVGDPKGEYCDLNMIFLSKEYEWYNDWSIELNQHSDQDGWEYAEKFNGIFGVDEIGMFVRRRKWIRYAKKKE